MSKSQGTIALQAIVNLLVDVVIALPGSIQQNIYDLWPIKFWYTVQLGCTEQLEVSRLEGLLCSL